MQYISSLPSDSYNSTFPRKISICGSTGSIGISTLKIVDAYKDLFEVIALGAGKNIELLFEQVKKFLPQYIVLQDEEILVQFKELIKSFEAYKKNNYKPIFLYGQEGYEHIACLEEISTFVSAQVGASGLRATFAAAKAGKVICIANKESLVLAGHVLRDICAQSKACLLPIDSEHHALFQALLGHEYKDVKKLLLTASGGAFRGKNSHYLQNAKASEALNHPTWSMGSKITIDSATLMNKGFEVIEACHLYGVDIDSVDVVIHPQSIIHSMVEYKDNSLIAHLSSPDMRLPISHALLYPRMPEGEICALPLLDLIKQSSITFEAVDNISFPCLELAKRAYREQKCVALNAANEILVEAYLQDRISFMDIARIIEKVLGKAQNDGNTLEAILELDKEYRRLTYNYI